MKDFEHNRRCSERNGTDQTTQRRHQTCAPELNGTPRSPGTKCPDGGLQSWVSDFSVPMEFLRLFRGHEEPVITTKYLIAGNPTALDLPEQRQTSKEQR